MKELNVQRPGPDATPEERAEWKRMHAELGQETAAKLRRIMSGPTLLPEPSPEPPDPKDDGPILQ
jgi:hypothetical protein